MSKLHEEIQTAKNPIANIEDIANITGIANIAKIVDIANISNQYCRNYKCLSYMKKFRLKETLLQIS